MPNNKNKHSGGVSCSACNAIFSVHSYVVTNPYMAYKPENLDSLKKIAAIIQKFQCDFIKE